MKGLILVKPHGTYINEHKKKLIVKSRKFNILNQEFMLVEGNYGLGIIKITKIFPISRAEYEKLEDVHRISPTEHDKWWGRSRDKYWAYGFSYQPFQKPKEIERPTGPQVIIKSVKLKRKSELLNVLGTIHDAGWNSIWTYETYLNEFDFIYTKFSEFIGNIRAYIPSKIGTKQLKDDWRIVLAWYTTIKERKPFKFPLEDVENLALMIFKELKKRKIKFHPEQYKQWSLDLYKKTLKRYETKQIEFEKLAFIRPSGSKQGRRITIEEVLKPLESFKVKKPRIFLTGGIVNNGYSDNDIEVLIQAPEEDKYLYHPVEFRIWRQFPSDLWKRFHFLYNEIGPFTNFIELYDEKYEVQKPFKLQYMDETEFVQKPFHYPGGKYYQTKDIKPLIPNHKIFVEPFCGSCSVFFSKEPSPIEVLSDKEPNIINGLKDLQSLTKETLSSINKMNRPKSRKTFNQMKNSKPKSTAQRFYRFLYLTEHSWNGNRETYSPSEDKLKVTEWTLWPAHERLAQPQVKIFCKDWKQIIRIYDSKDTFFYLDPPYAKEESEKPKLNVASWYGHIPLDELVNVLKKVKGKFLMSHDWKPEVIKTFSRKGFYLKRIKNPRLVGRTRLPEQKHKLYGYDLLVSNYPLKRYSYYQEFENFQRVTGKMKEQADKSRQENKIVPFRFFYQMKGIKGYRKQEVYSIDGLKEVIRGIKEFYPAGIDQKYDGFRVQIHRVGNKVKIWSEDGGDVTHRFPLVVKEIKTWKWNVILDAEMTGWTKGYRKGEHLGRAEISGWAHKKGDPYAFKNYYANVFDILYAERTSRTSESESTKNLQEGDIHNESFSVRREHLERKPTGDHIKIAELKIVKSEKELAPIIKYFSAIPGSEGAMVKSMNKMVYELDGMTTYMVKFKKEADLDSEVVDIKQVVKTKGLKKPKLMNIFNYLCIIRDERGNPIPVGRCYNIAPKTLKMKRPLKIGEILRVAFVNLNKYTDPKTGEVWYNWWAPRPIEWRFEKKKPDSTFTAERIVTQTHGERKSRPFPKRYKDVFKKLKMDEFESDKNFKNLTEYYPRRIGTNRYVLEQQPKTSFFQDPFLIPVDESKKWRFVAQVHIRGRSLHIDDRRQFQPELCRGFSHFVGKEKRERLLSRTPKDFEDAKKLYYKEVHPDVVKHLKDPKMKFLSGTKAIVPVEWLDVEGKVEPGEVGATRFLPGYFIIIDKGEIEHGSTKPYFHEMWFHGIKKLFNGQFVDRLIEARKEWKRIGKELFSWMFFRTKFSPYILSKRSIDRKYNPPYLTSALPKAVRTKVPKEFQYWKIKNDKNRFENRKQLVDQIKVKKVKLFEIGKTVPFKLKYQWWKGPEVVRVGPSEERWHLIFDFESLEYKTKIPRFVLFQDPRKVSSLTAYSQPGKKEDLWDVKGDLKVRHPFFGLPKYKKLGSHVTDLDTGTATIISWTPTFKKVRFKGKELIGLFIFEKEEPKKPESKLWVMSRTQIAPEIRTEIFNETEFIERFESNGELHFSKSSQGDYLDVHGMMFHPGKIKDVPFTKENLSEAVLVPPEGKNLCYINFYHMKDEPTRIGILKRIKWDSNFEWTCKLDNTKRKGGLMFEGTVTDPEAITLIQTNKLTSVSGEIAWKGNEQKAQDIQIRGMAYTSSPACKECETVKICKDGKCKFLNR